MKNVEFEYLKESKSICFMQPTGTAKYFYFRVNKGDRSEIQRIERLEKECAIKTMCVFYKNKEGDPEYEIKENNFYSEREVKLVKILFDIYKLRNYKFISEGKPMYIEAFDKIFSINMCTIDGELKYIVGICDLEPSIHYKSCTYDTIGVFECRNEADNEFRYTQLPSDERDKNVEAFESLLSDCINNPNGYDKKVLTSEHLAYLKYSVDIRTLFKEFKNKVKTEFNVTKLKFDIDTYSECNDQCIYTINNLSNTFDTTRFDVFTL